MKNISIVKMIKTRRAAIEDLPSLVEVNKSDVEEWHHFSRDGRGAAAPYDELTGWERVMHGGPWEDLHALRRHWPYMERVGIICLVAELDGRVVGHLYVIPTRELGLGEYLFLDVFMVHRSYRRRGVGTALLRAAEALAAEESLPRLVVMTDYEEAGGLTYRSYGFEPFHEMCALEAEIGSPPVPTGVMITDPPLEQPLDSHRMVCGWWNTSSKNWMGCFEHDEYELMLGWNKVLLGLDTGSGFTYFKLASGYPTRPLFALCMWTPLDADAATLSMAVQAIGSVARSMGAEVLTTIALEKDRGLLEAAGFTYKRRRDPLLHKELDT